MRKTSLRDRNGVFCIRTCTFDTITSSLDKLDTLEPFLFRAFELVAFFMDDVFNFGWRGRTKRGTRERLTFVKFACRGVMLFAGTILDDFLASCSMGFTREVLPLESLAAGKTRTARDLILAEMLTER